MVDEAHRIFDNEAHRKHLVKYEIVTPSRFVTGHIILVQSRDPRRTDYCVGPFDTEQEAEQYIADEFDVEFAFAGPYLIMRPLEKGD